MQQPPTTPPANASTAHGDITTSGSRASTGDAPSSAHSNDPASTSSPVTSKPSSPAFPFGQLPTSPGFLSAPTLQSYPSPLRQHRRTPSQHREVKETLNAVSEFADDDEDGSSHHKINQYTINFMIGRGSYGSVHVATDQYGKEFAVKEFSKARLRKRARSNLMKQGPFRAGRFPGLGGPVGPRGPSSRLEGEAQAEAKDALYLIREEIAIMKKLNHPNLVELIEVLDDPEQDSLYMVLEMCKKGVIMDVGLGKTAKPYDAEACRCWFRDLILGIEYLHAQNIIHRDIKPDNLLITDDDVLKIGDFGVSEMFEKADGMRTSKTAGSPAFFPPELCVSNHGGVEGPPCDIWSMGVTLYCLRYGKIPFEQETMVDIYEAINTAEVKLPEDEDEQFVDLMGKILEKDPSKRITMAQLREHPWVTLNGDDPLLSTEENCANPIEPPNALELNHAFTQNMGNLLCVLKAIRKFKGLLRSRNRDPNLAVPPLASDVAELGSHVSSIRVSSDQERMTEDEVARLVEERRNNIRKASLQTSRLLGTTAVEGQRGGSTSARDDTDGRENGTGIGVDQPTLLLGIGTGGGDEFGPDRQHDEPEDVVSESPTTAEFDVYDRAFQSEVARIQSQGSKSKVYPTKVLESITRGGGGSGMADIVARLMTEKQQ
ncbi:calcium/calmodulin-dependent protein kinase kinase [Sporothrix schenckii 1099-18]|uniref:CAMKK/CAMKK-META protein kinase n=2 Tax=Sporothrix schenckii TaxID=29908 RepID=U7PTE8_SPOS1|nr:calcium/calmodulin-dependent protein kinase kinase [Sporothrix schenckii 1099-18]ERS97755.1 CAMKK/CAMKK-META protein kinase [Sporothrix schenckii ATCC 58251]KJR82301.1 calcium/calmodulin-dependent protein kinase kinase [Sporothrix schenckii 1099-18]